MKGKQVLELFGVPYSTLKDWKGKRGHPRHNLGLYLSSLDYEKTKKEIEALNKKELTT